MFEGLLKKNFWQSLFTTGTAGRTKFTFEELRSLNEVLTKNQVVTEANRALVVETIRSIAEFMIWGDQNEPRIFDFFLENNIMHYLHRVLQQPANRSGDVAKQVLQTLSIIIQNIRSETGTYFLFSNNHINNIVEIRFDFEDEEVLGYYISFLKTISLKLNMRTVQFFFDRRDSQYTFPLYSEAVKFAHHKEGMVRAGVRTLTLNVYSVVDPYIQEFVCRPPATGYLTDMVAYIADQIKILDKRMALAEGFSAQVLSSLDSQLAEVEDMISYTADILNTAHPRFAHLTAQQLWASLVGPFLLRPLMEYGSSSGAGHGAAGPRTSTGSTPPSPRAAPVRAACSLYCLERIFVLISYPPLLHNLALALMDPRPGHPSCRAALAALLRSEDHRAVPAALRCLVALVNSRHMAPELMALLGLVPRARAADLHAACAASDCAACRLREQLPPLPEGCSAAAGLPPDALAEEAQPVTTSVGMGSSTSSGGGGGALVFGYHVLWTRLEGPALAASARQGYSGDGEEEGGEAAGAGLYAEGGGGQGADPAAAGGPEEHDLLGLGTDDSNAGASGAPGPLPDGSLPKLIEVKPETPLQYSVADQQDGAALGPDGSGAAQAVPEGDLLQLDEPSGSGGVAQQGPAAAAQQESQAQPQQRREEEADLLGLGDSLLPPSATAATACTTATATAANTGTHTPAAADSPRAGTSAPGGAATADLLGFGPSEQPEADSQGVEQGTSGFGEAGPGSVLEVAGGGQETGASAEQPASACIGSDPSAPGHNEPGTSGRPDGGTIAGLLDMLPQAAAAAAAVAASALASTSAALVDPLGASGPGAGPSSAASSSALGSAAYSGSSPSLATTAAASAAPSLLESSGSARGRQGPSQEEAPGPSPAPPAPPAPPPPPPQPQGPPCAVHARPAALAASSDLLDALFALLSMQLLSVPGLWNTGLLIGQLYPRAEEQRELREQQQQQAEAKHAGLVSASTAAAPPPAGAEAASGLADQFADLLGVGTMATGVGGPASGAELQGAAGGAGSVAGAGGDTADERGVAQPSASAAVPTAGPVAAAPVAAASTSAAEAGPNGGSGAVPAPAPEPHPLDPSSTVGWACELSGPQREALRVASESANTAILDVVGGMWCDAVMAMLAMEWPAAHDAMTRPALRTGAEVLMAGPHLYPTQHARTLSGHGRNDQGLSGSAVAALHSYHAVARLVALLHLHGLLRRGATGRRPPPSCPMPASGELESREWDVLEGQEVELQASSSIPCIVSFSPGQERRVYFAAVGPALRRVEHYVHDPQALLADPAAQAVALHSSPAVVLADPAPTRLNLGIVLSVSPLLGSEPSLDKSVAKWLHVHVRPSVRGLLRLLRSAAAGRKGGLLGALRHLVDGHWVLAFTDAERSSNARQMVEESAHRLRALYVELLGPLLRSVVD